MMREQILDALAEHFKAHISKHLMNGEIMLSNPMAIHEHTDFMSAIELELEQVAEYHDKLEVLETYL